MKFKILFVGILLTLTSCTMKYPCYTFTIEDEYGVRNSQNFEGYQEYIFEGTLIAISGKDTVVIKFNDHKLLNANKDE